MQNAYETARLIDAWHHAVNHRDLAAARALVTDPVEVSGPRGTGRITARAFADWIIASGIRLRPLRTHPIDDVTVVVEQEATWPDNADPQAVATLFRVRDGALGTIRRFESPAAALTAAGDRHPYAEAMAAPDLGRVFNEVPELYDRVRPGYPDALFADLATITGRADRPAVLEVGCGTGQATRSLAALGYPVTAVEPGAEMAAVARERLAGFPGVQVETSKFEQWDDRGRRFDLVLAATSWHWVDPAVGWRRAHDVLRPGGWLALLGNIVVRRPGEPEVYAETADLHEHYVPGSPDWGHPPTEDEARTPEEDWGPLFGPTTTRWYPTVQWFDGAGYADLMRSTSLYRKLNPGVREPLLAGIAERIRTRMGDRASRRYLTFLRVAQRLPLEEY